jgi:hypothetical protein
VASWHLAVKARSNPGCLTQFVRPQPGFVTPYHYWNISPCMTGGAGIITMFVAV